MTVTVDVVLSVFRDLVLNAGFVGQHVVALPIRCRFLKDVANVKGRQVGVGLEHQGHGTGDTGGGHARSAEGDVPVPGVVLNRHHVGAHKGNVGFDTPFFGWTLAAVNGDSGVLVQRPNRDDVLG